MKSFEEYQTEALRSEKPLQEVVTDAAVLKDSLIAGEAFANYIDQLKKVVVYGKPLDYGVLLQHIDTAIDTMLTLSETVMFRGDRNTPGKVNIAPRVLHASLGLYGESGELFAALLHQLNGEPLDVSNLEEEGGDQFWYLALLCSAITQLGGANGTDIQRMNVAKLQARYPALFTLAASVERDVGAERQAMEEARAAA